MIKTILLIIGLAVSMNVSAFDIYGVSDADSKKILKKYGQDIAKFEALFQTEIEKEALNKTVSSEETNAQKLLSKQRLELIDTLSKYYGYLFVDFQVISYPDEHNKVYMTIEIVNKQHPERLRFVNTNAKPEHTDKKRAHKPDVIEAMITYTAMGFELLLHQELGHLPPCPVYHCTMGFKNPKLKPYLKIFNQAAIKEKALIIKTLNQDPDPERQAAAAFLVGHFRDPHEIVSILSPHINDKDEGVRNNVMRVIGATIAKAKLRDLDVTPFLNALDSPYTTDRNKALYVLFGASASKALRPVILQKGGDRLVSLLELKQPNNHDWAYLILKNITGKDYGATNVAAWRASLGTAHE